jgi:hypothetical protein
MGHYENDLVVKLTNHFTAFDIDAIAYRNKQSRFSEQLCDINVDSILPEWYLAIEVKSKRGKRALNFQNDFTTDQDGTHQITRLYDFACLSGRSPLIVLCCRMGKGNPNKVYVFDAVDIYNRYMDGGTSILAKEYDDLHIKRLDEVI